MNNVEVSQQTTYRLHIQQGTAEEMAILRWRHNMWMRSHDRKYRAHAAMHPPCTTLHLGWPFKVQQHIKVLRRKMEDNGLMTRWYNENKTDCYLLLLDASKASDRVENNKLFNRLRDRNMCPIDYWWICILIRKFRVFRGFWKEDLFHKSTKNINRNIYNKQSKKTSGITQWSEERRKKNEIIATISWI